MDTDLKRTPLYEEHIRLKARMVPFTGYSMPVQYTGLVDEHHAVRQRVGLFDVSHMGELVIEGPAARSEVDRLVTNDTLSLIDGQARYTLCCDAEGHALDDLIVYRVAADKVLVVCNASNREKIVGHFTREVRGATVRDISDDTALIAVQGPKAMALLADAGVDPRVGELPAFHFADAELFNAPCTFSRTGYTGEDGVEVFCPPGEAARVWRSLLSLGEPYGVAPAGLGCRNTLRLECRMALYGNDIDETTDPIEAGLGWAVRLDAGDFIGKEAIAKVKAEGPTRKLVGFEMTDRAIARDHWEVVDEAGAKLGYVTSGSPSPTTGKNIGLAYVPVAMSSIGTTLRLKDPARERFGAAVVVKTPWYKRAK